MKKDRRQSFEEYCARMDAKDGLNQAKREAKKIVLDDHWDEYAQLVKDRCGVILVRK